MNRIIVWPLVVFLFVGFGAGHLQLRAQAIEWMDPYWVKGAKLESAEAVVIAIDTSGSIQVADRLPREKTMAIGILNVLFAQNNRDPWLAVYSFDTDIHYVIEPTRLSRLNLADAIAAIMAIQDTGYFTWLSGAIDEACNVTRPVRPAGTLVLMTDGKPTTPDRNGSKDIAEAMVAATASAQLFKDNCSTLAVIGFDVSGEDAEFLQKIASPGAFLAVTFPGPPPPEQPEINVTGPSAVVVGDNATLVLEITYQGDRVPANEIISIHYYVFDATGALVRSSNGTVIDDGFAMIEVDTTGLCAGAASVEITATLLPFSEPSRRTFSFFMLDAPAPRSGSLSPNAGVAFAQVDFTWAGGEVRDSATGQVEVDLGRLRELGIESGFMNVLTRLGWVVQNFPIAGDFPYPCLSTMFRIAESDGTPVESLDAYIVLSSVPLTERPQGPFSLFPVETAEFNAQGFGEQLEGPPPAAPVPGAVQFGLGALIQFCWQPRHLNVEAADNQCAPAAAASSLDWLRTTYGVSVPRGHRNVPGLRRDGSLVGELCWHMNRGVTNRCTGKPVGPADFLKGKLCYISVNGLNLVVKHQGALGGANFTACDRVSLAQGAVVTSAFIVDGVCGGENVELGYVWPKGGHMVEVVGAGYIFGVPWIAHRSDQVQCNDLVGTAGTQFGFLVDTDGDGLLNLVGEPGTPNVTFVCTESVP